MSLKSEPSVHSSHKYLLSTYDVPRLPAPFTRWCLQKSTRWRCGEVGWLCSKGGCPEGSPRMAGEIDR